MHPFLVLEHLQENFKNYVLSKYPWTSTESEYKRLEELCLTAGQVFQDPIIQLDKPRKKARRLLSGEPGFFSPELCRLLQDGFPPARDGKYRNFTEPFSHQLQAWERISAGQATVISTGTGSGKSEAFMFPLLDRVYRAKHRAGESSGGNRRVVRALVIYPMNALIEDQHIRFCRYAWRLGLKVGVYNGSFNEQRRRNELQVFQKRVHKGIFGEEEPLRSEAELRKITEWVDAEQPDTFPDVLLTNYSMLQYMLLRKREHEIFRSADIQVLALDEAHLYSGTLGLEMSALIARLKTHIESLGGSVSGCVPVATSATLVRGDETESEERMRGFFESLFSQPFSDGWIIRDQFEEPQQPDPSLWTSLQFPAEKFKTVFAEAKKDVSKSAHLLKQAASEIANLENLAAQLPTILLSDLKPQEPKNIRNLGSVTSLGEAARRYGQWRLGREIVSPEELQTLTLEVKALLSATAVRQREAAGDTNPLLGVRLHSFVRSEPRLFRSFKRLSSSGKLETGKILSEDEVIEHNNNHHSERLFALPAAFCKNCGHEGWIVTAEDQGTGSEIELTPLNRQPLPDDKIIVLHPAELESSNWPADWKSEFLQVSLSEQGTFVAQKIARTRQNSRTRGGNPLLAEAAMAEPESATMQKFMRVERRVDKVTRPDNTHCPNCLSTHDEQMRVSRGSPASDLSVHSRHLLAAAEDNDERRLLMFCDNRQDTSFLAGFMTDRHKRFRLRRAIYQALMTNKVNPAVLKIVDDSRADRLDYPFARIVLKELKATLGDETTEGKVSTTTLRQTLTSDLFDFDNFESSWDEKHLRFIEATEPSSLVRTSNSADLDYQIKLDDSEGVFALKLLNEGILRDLSLGAYKEGALGTLGMACLWSDALEKIKNPEEKILAWKVFTSLEDEGHWTSRPDGLKLNGFNNRRRSPTVDELVEKMLSKRTDLGKFIEQNCPTMLAFEKPEEHFGQMLRRWDEAGLLFIRRDGRNAVQLLARTLRVCSDVAVYCSRVKKKKETVAASFELSRVLATKKPNDLFDRMGAAEMEVPESWRKLYVEPATADHFVRAREHNAMLDPDVATAVIQIFGEKELKKRTINTVIATPTLEMGIDLPDLPVVIHRSVPPDPSNYAQRSGRAGRDKKRAFLLAHCGRGSHDSSYFIEPEAMVAGEIIPPGCPRANTTILQRHVSAMCLQYLAEHGMDVNNWDAYLNRADWFNWLRDRVGLQSSEPNERIRPFEWRDLISQRKAKEEILGRVGSIITKLNAGLWREDLLGEVNRSLLEQSLKAVVEGDDFARALDKAISEYADFINKKKAKYESLRDLDRERFMVLADIKSLLGGFGNDKNTIRPIGWLQLRSLLPNFDFPSSVATFTGFRYRKSNGSNRDDRSQRYEVAVRFARGLNQAMREFCPEQSLYAAGAKFEVKRYAVDKSSMSRQEQRFGVCEKGCTQLTPLNDHSVSCRVCGSALVGNAEHRTQLPPIYRLLRAEGHVVESIGDSRAEKDNSILVREALVVGQHDGERVSAQTSVLGSTVVRHYQHSPRASQNASQEKLLDLMMIVGAKRKDASGRATRSLNPLFASSAEADEFSVSLHQQDEDKPNSCIHPFLLGNRFSAEGVHFKIDFSNTGLPSGQDILEKQYATFQATLMKSIRRELFLGPRSQTMDTFLDVAINRSGETSSKEIHGAYFFDAIPGGSGVMALVRQNWRGICRRAHKIVTQSECCLSSCKRCIATFDNQSQHALLDKRLLKDGNNESSIFILLEDLFNPKTLNWKREHESPMPAGSGDPTPQFAEQCFRAFMAENFPNMRYVEQEEINRLFSDQTVTISDTVITEKGRNIAIYIDGYQYHGLSERFIGDIHKRNFVEIKNSLTCLTIPAQWVVPPPERRRWDLIKNSINKRFLQLEPQAPDTQRAPFSTNEDLYIIPDKFEQYEWLFSSPPKMVRGQIEEDSVLAKPIAYHTEKKILVVETSVHQLVDEENIINKEKWHEFWEQLNALQIKYGKVFVLLRKDEALRQ